MKTACIFPGQGSQKLGMGEELFNIYPQLVKMANEILGYSIDELCLKDPEQKLNNTEYTQPALYTVNALSYLKYIESGKAPLYLAGHSLGEYNALVAAGVLTFEEGLRLVSLRGKLMSEASNGSMAAVIGLDKKNLKNIINTNFPGIEIANYNSYTQNVIAGPTRLINDCEKKFDNMKVNYLKLNVSGAFHSSYMQPVQEKFDNLLSKIEFKEPCIPILSNYTAMTYKHQTVKENLSMHLTNPVRWVDIIENIMNNVDKIVHIGPGRVLEGLTKRIKNGQ